MKSITDCILDADPNGLLTHVYDGIKRFGLLILAAVSVAVFLLCPTLREPLRFFHIACIVLSTVIGRSFLRQEDIRGWLWQNIALFAHAVLIIINNLTVA